MFFLLVGVYWRWVRAWYGKFVGGVGVWGCGGVVVVVRSLGIGVVRAGVVGAGVVFGVISRGGCIYLRFL